jgi:hypothetical protein
MLGTSAWSGATPPQALVRARLTGEVLPATVSSAHDKADKNKLVPPGGRLPLEKLLVVSSVHDFRVADITNKVYDPADCFNRRTTGLHSPMEI